MLLPTTYSAMVIALILTALFGGLWANTLLVDRKWRFELYAFDFAFGGMAGALLLAYTLGNSGTSDTFTFEDSLTVASKRNMLMAVGAGAIFALGQMMTLAGISLAGLSTAFLASAGVSLIITVAIRAMGAGVTGNGMVYGAAAAALVAVLVTGLAQRAAAKEAPVKRGMHPGTKGYILSCVGGLIAGLYPPVLNASRVGDIGLGSYGAVVFLALGALLLTPLYNVYFLNLPVQGAALSPLAYLKGTKKQHLLGLAGGLLWAAGTVAFFAAAGAMYAGATSLLGIHAVAFGGAIFAALCGLIFWGEPAGAPKAKGLFFGSVAVLTAAVGLLAAGA